MRDIRGITLIALIITIIVLLILAGVTLKIAIGENGIISKTEMATQENTKQEAKEIMNLKITNIQMKSYAQSEQLPGLQYLADNLCEDKDVEYVIKKQGDIASLQKIDVSDVNSIFTKLKKYPYEFEINSNMQLASIDGVKVATGTQQETQKQCNPKLLTDIILPNSNSVTRALGTYYANTSAYTKTNTENFEKYLTYSEENGWVVQKSGNYLISTYLSIHRSQASDSAVDMTINDTTLMLVKRFCKGRR